MNNTNRRYVSISVNMDKSNIMNVNDKWSTLARYGQRMRHIINTVHNIDDMSMNKEHSR